MSKASQWTQELNLSEEQLQDIIAALKPIVEEHNNQAPYDIVEDALKNRGFTKADAQKVMAVLYAREIYLETINSWDYKPFALINYMKQLES
ncbi:hypothetical protein HA075_21520 [bacterium BFN5]|nr:hypothetical protein HA075_21515 [bacterium BFN5]QJW48077.1 hypothetical protein HA075_21520 [bacterium BFN5]